ncbi:hypothetical protein F5144DRAFT_176991 [Chaetomium tenue]|uniref:Uncharacterized protein n=1 Tax=Chaetomium tenue TaxID=1854479 RepID=A0ACB7PH55_9PEZI|nr:hypothetical protein F5144DRAFT_176991 [Chaetomium globosum]
METSNMASGNGSVLSDPAPLSMGWSSPNKQSLGDFSAANLLTLGSPDFNKHMYELRPSTEIDATRLKVPGWTDLSEADERELIQRIAKWMDTLSHPIDLDQVNDRLLQFQASGLPVTRPPPASWTTTPDKEESHRCLIVRETVAYNALVGDGGWPWYSFDLLDGVSRDHEDHREMLGTLGLDNGGDVYRTQFMRWKKFRRWQADNRGIFDIETDLRKKQAHDALEKKSLGLDPPCHDPEWERKRLTEERTREHRNCVKLGVAKMQGENRFPVYVQAAQTRLKRHSFTRGFQPAQDHLHQDQLTTWIEYLNYEYWVQDGLVDRAARCQLEYEKTLKALFDERIVVQGETPESFIESHNLPELEYERDRAETAVKEAESNIAARQEALGDTNNMQALTTKAVFCKRAKEKADKHLFLLQWTLDQVPLIEAGMMEGGDVTTPGGRKGRPDHKGNLDGPNPQMHQPHALTPEEVVPPAGRPGRTHSSPSPKRLRSDVDEGDGEGPEGATTKRLRLDAQAVRGTQPAPELQVPVVPSTLSSAKRTRSDNDNEEESEAPIAKRLKPNAQIFRSHQPGKEMRCTRGRQAPKGEYVVAALNNEAAMEEGPQRPADTGPTAAAKRSHQAQPPTRRSSRIAGRVQAEEPSVKAAATDLKATEALPEPVPEPIAHASKKKPAVAKVQSAAPLGKKSQPKEKSEPNSPKPAKPLPKKGRPKAQPAKSLPRKAPAKADPVEKAPVKAGPMKKPETKKAPAKKALAKKAPVKQQQPKMVQPEKSPVKKPETRKAQPKKAQPKKTQPKRTQPKRVQPKRAQPKQGQPKKTQPKRVQPKRAQPKQGQPKKTQPKRVQPKRAQPKQGQPKETQPKKTRRKRGSAKKSEPKKAPVKKAPARKAPVKKPDPKRVRSKKPETERAQPRRVQPKRIPPKKT